MYVYTYSDISMDSVGWKFNEKCKEMGERQWPPSDANTVDLEL
jgi:hypothetical protein